MPRLRPSKLGSHSGFTLLQLVTAMGILGALAAASVPRVSSWSDAHEIREVPRRLFADLQGARALAILENNRYHVRLVAGRNDAYEIHDDDDGDGVVDPGERVRKRDFANERSGITLSATATITLTPRGISPSPGSITLTTSSGLSATVVVNAAGQTRIL